ncbi:hypothetical protein [Candidatus Accumulibacter vicinus]|uniref:hypothetical protein n=1 Tax=Candidatus Accumulibacter vicinus TaxID=2954382 RepID=UPI00235B5CEF|nr:hypothetical protein [Candidatus Accumulibacter vicinus]
MIEVLRSVVGVESDNHERELIDDQRQHRQQKGLTDSWYARLDLPLTHGIDAGEVIDALDAILLDRRQPCFVRVDHPPCDEQPTPHFLRDFFRSGSFLGGNTTLVQAHTRLDKATVCVPTRDAR